MNLIEHLVRQQTFSLKTFGPGTRQKGVIAHIKEELREVKTGGNDPKEWVDVVLLGLDGLWRSIKDKNPSMTESQIAATICEMIDRKLTKNEARDWPDWKTADPNAPINHVRGKED